METDSQTSNKLRLKVVPPPPLDDDVMSQRSGRSALSRRHDKRLDSNTKEAQTSALAKMKKVKKSRALRKQNDECLQDEDEEIEDSEDDVETGDEMDDFEEEKDYGFSDIEGPPQVAPTEDEFNQHHHEEVQQDDAQSEVVTPSSTDGLQSDVQQQAAATSQINLRPRSPTKNAKSIDLVKSIQIGKFQPAILAIEKGLISPLDVVDVDSGYTLLHFICFFGNIKALKFVMYKICDAAPSIGEAIEQVSSVLLAKDTVEMGSSIQNTPLHQAIIGGELPTFSALINFEQFFPLEVRSEIKDNPAFSEQIARLKWQMISQTNGNLDTPLMACILHNQMEMFLYLLYKFQTFYKGRGLECLDIEGNTLLHLTALNQQHSMGLYFAKVLFNLEYSTHFSQMMNASNSFGCTPLFLAVKNQNLELIQYFMDPSRCQSDLSLKSKDGDTIHEFVERTHKQVFAPDYLEPDYYQVIFGSRTQVRDLYVKNEIDLVVQSFLERGEIRKRKVSPRDFARVLDISFKRGASFWWIGATNLVDQIFKQSPAAYPICHVIYMVLLFLTFGALSIETDDDQSLLAIVFTIAWFAQLFVTMILLSKDNDTVQSVDPYFVSDLGLGNHVIDLISQQKFTQLQKQREQFCFDCMAVHQRQKDLKIAHDPRTQHCIINFQKHSYLLGKSIGGQLTLHLYMAFLWFNLLLITLWFKKSMDINGGNTEASSFFRAIRSTFILWNDSKILSLIQLSLLKLWFYIIGVLIDLHFAQSRGISLHQLNNIANIESTEKEQALENAQNSAQVVDPFKPTQLDEFVVTKITRPLSSSEDGDDEGVIDTMSDPTEYFYSHKVQDWKQFWLGGFKPLVFGPKLRLKQPITQEVIKAIGAFKNWITIQTQATPQTSQSQEQYIQLAQSNQISHREEKDQ